MIYLPSGTGKSWPMLPQPASFRVSPLVTVTADVRRKYRVQWGKDGYLIGICPQCDEVYVAAHEETPASLLVEVIQKHERKDHGS